MYFDTKKEEEKTKKIMKNPKLEIEDARRGWKNKTKNKWWIFTRNKWIFKNNRDRLRHIRRAILRNIRKKSTIGRKHI